MTAFRRAARAFAGTLRTAPLASTAANPSHPAQVTAVTCVVEHAGHSEVVTLRLRDGTLSLVCTCGKTACDHAHAALALLDAVEPQEVEVLELGERRSSEWVDLPMRVSELPAPQLKAGLDVREELATALTDVRTAVARSGLSEGVSAGVLEALERVGRYTSTPNTVGLRGFVGALRSGLEARDKDTTVRALAAANTMIEALRATTPTEASELRIATWLGPSSGTVLSSAPSSPVSHALNNARVSERTYLELSREQRPGLTRADIERRYLFDLADGALYREDRSPNEPNVSVGPCPRSINVGFAHLEPGLPPRRIRLLQYTTTPMVELSVFEKVASFALPSFEPLLQRHRDHVQQGGELSDLLALVRPARTAERAPSQTDVRLLDEAGHALPLRGNEGVARKLEIFLSEATPLWVFGRVLQQGTELVLVPLAACARKHGRATHLQL